MKKVLLLLSALVTVGVTGKDPIVKDEDSSVNHPTLEDLCSLPSTGDEGFVDEDMAMFWNLCPSMKRPESIFPPQYCEDSSANVCLVKIDQSTGKRSKMVSNAGTLSSASNLIYEKSGHYALNLDHGEPCDSGGNYTTTFDFFCNDGEPESDPQKSVFRSKSTSKCHISVMWTTSLACPSDLRPSRGCKINVPIFDQTLDLAVLSKKDYYEVDAGTSDFRINFCRAIGQGVCAGRPVCQVDKNGTLMKEIMSKSYNTSAYYDETAKAVRLTYTSKDDSKVVNIKIRCSPGTDSSQIKHLRSIQGHESYPDTYDFEMNTNRVCMTPSVTCEVRDFVSGKLYDLSTLKTSTENWDAFDPASSRRYFLSVCKPLSPASGDYDCPGKSTAACAVDTERDEAFSLGQVSGGPELSPDGSIMITYVNGSLCNAHKHFSSVITFRCADRESGPIFQSSHDCRTRFDWRTPAACPQKRLTTDSCKLTVAEMGHTFDLSTLRNESGDLQISSENGEITINICGGLVSRNSSGTKGVTACRDGTPLGLEKNRRLEYFDGDLKMTAKGGKCKADLGQDHVLIINFLCDHKAGRSRPEVIESQGCRTVMTWRTTMACSPFEEIECVTQDNKGRTFDLTELSLPDQNYNLKVNQTTTFVLNVCRTIVSGSFAAGCPYKSASCLKVGSKGYSAGTVVEGPKMDPREGLILEYKMGRICSDPDSSETHERTKIVFRCDFKGLHTVPEFIKKEGCTYIFIWTHKVACGFSNHTLIGKKFCEITHPITGHTFDFSPLSKTSLHFRDQDRNFQVGICSQGCSGSKSGVCLTTKGKSYGVGEFDGSLRMNYRGEIFLNYSRGGDQCLENPMERYSSLIIFRCAPIRKHPSIFVNSQGGCQNVINVFTSLACDKTVSCLVPNTNIDFAPLMNYSSDVQLPDGTVVSICKPLSHHNRNSCPLGAGICHPGSGTSYGFPAKPPQLESSGVFTLDYINGSKCQGNQTFSSRITFKCNRSQYPGRLKKAAEDSRPCHKDFEWPTLLACENATIGMALDEGCSLSPPLNKAKVDLKAFKTFKVCQGQCKTFGRAFEVQACGVVGSGCNGSICATRPMPFSLGKATKARYNFNNNEIIVSYDGGSTCIENPQEKHTAEIRFSCDRSLRDCQGRPKFLFDLPCHSVFDWPTKLVCEDAEDQCNPKIHKLEPSASSSWMVITGGIVMATFIVFYAYKGRRRYYRSLDRLLDWTRTRFERTRRRDDDYLIRDDIQVPTFGSLTSNEDDDDELIIA